MSDSFVVPISQSSGDGAIELVTVGATFTGFLDRVAPPGSTKTLLEDATSILGSCEVSEVTVSANTGLVVGRVQSGKTLSYEAVIALARDNGFSLVVVISGISNPLLDQGVGRLKRDLTEADPDGWSFLINPADDPQQESTLRSIRDNWSDPSTPSQLKKTAVCLLLKHSGRISGFKDLCERLGWQGQKVLIIDDEADQASLNISFRRGAESPTYKNILALRRCFPHHAYLQYTATPQAPLLLAITDVLSPDFVRVLEPGEDYVGGPDFFGSSSGLVRVISEADLVLATDPNGPPPSSLAEALREFVLGAANVLVSGRLEIRSMLVHPSRYTAPHLTFLRWIKTIVGFWQGAIEDEEEAETLKEAFRLSWDSLRGTDPLIADFDLCWNNVRFVLRNLQLVEMNSRDAHTPVIEWDSSKAYVLVGGQALDRGFTVNGLSVTYMPRDPGNWTADTIQQRARFFGYKRKFLGQCRVFLEPGLRDAFVMYVEHEKHMISTLRDVQEGETTLKDWERNFYLDPTMKPTRQSVQSLPTVHVAPGERWVFDARPALPSSTFEPAESVLNRYLAEFDENHDEYGHLRSIVPMKTLLDMVTDLADVESSGEPDLPQVRALRLHIARLTDDDATETVRVIRIRPDVESSRTLTKSGLVQPFQGRNSAYPGDREVFDPLRLTIQIHKFALRRTKLDEPFASMLMLAFWTPERLAGGWLVEDVDA